MAIGSRAGQIVQASGAVSVGFYAGSRTQGGNAVAMGSYAGSVSQGLYAVAIGSGAATISQGFSSVAIGSGAGNVAQGLNSVAIGVNSASISQGGSSIAIGNAAASSSQGSNAVAIGTNAATSTQGGNAIAIGYNAGFFVQSGNAVAVGVGAGQTGQGGNAVAIGAYAGMTGQHQYSIVINATGQPLNTATQSAWYVSPIRSTGATTSVLLYNTSTSEIQYNSGKTFVIPHPLAPKERWLVHACLEGPETGVYYRGEDVIGAGGQCTVRLPDYVYGFAQNFSVQITPIYSQGLVDEDDEFGGVDDLPAMLKTSHVYKNQFKVYGPVGRRFFWLVMGSRQELNVEPLRSETVVHGNGPYRWI